MPPVLAPRSWSFWAHEYPTHDKKGTFFMHIGAKRYVELHGLPEPLIEITLTEDPTGPYYGWLRTGKSEPEMIYPHESLFSMCFPYGYKIEVEKGEGQVIRFNATRR